MTNTNTADPRPVLADALSLAGDVIAAVAPSQLGDPTPCTEFDVRALLDHLAGLPTRIAAIGRGDADFSTWPATPEGEWAAAWKSGVAELNDVWADDALLSRTLTLPWAEMPGAVALSIYVSEVTVHTWDLAVATGQSPAWDDDVVAASLAAMQQALPGGARPMAELPFADEVAVPADAPLIDRLAAYTGRSPRP